MSQQQTRRAKPPAVWLTLFCGIGIGALLTLGSQRFIADARSTPGPLPKTSPSASSVRQLLALTPNQIEALDVAVVNLLCAEGLPSDESVNVSTSLASLDAWANRVRSETQRHMYRFQRNPAEFN